VTTWLPRSTCGTGCLPSAGSVPRVSAGVAVLRTAAVLGVLAVAGGALCVLPLLPQRRRVRVVRSFARAVLWALGVRRVVAGRLPRHGGALVVANHVSWMDILVLLAYAPVRLLAKADVRRWPVVGPLAAGCGTVFIDRDRPRTLPATVGEVAAALRSGAVVAVFPEGTTWCGRSGGPFRPAMFQAAIDAGAPVVPVTLRFLLGSTPTTVAAFVGEETLLASFRRVVAVRGLQVRLSVHPALHPAAGASRRGLARTAASAVAVRPPEPAYVAMYRVAGTMRPCGPSASPLGSPLTARSAA